MIYKFVAISSEKESFVREFELDGNNTLLDFHNTIQEEMEFNESQMVSFFTTTDKWEKEEEFTLFDMGSNTTVMEDVAINEITINKNQKLIYIFDLFNERALFIEFHGEVDKIEDREYPICTDSKGLPPKQVLENGFSSTTSQPVDLEDPALLMDEKEELPELENLEDFDDI